MMLLENFSAGYWVTPLEVSLYGGKEAIVQDDLYYRLVGAVGTDTLVVSAGGSSYEVEPARQIPDDVVAVPESDANGTRDGDTVLISKQNGRGVTRYE